MIMTFIKTRESTNQSTKAEVEGDDCGEVLSRIARVLRLVGRTT
jgi:hypothetical protein